MPDPRDAPPPVAPWPTWGSASATSEEFLARLRETEATGRAAEAVEQAALRVAAVSRDLERALVDRETALAAERDALAEVDRLHAAALEREVAHQRLLAAAAAREAELAEQVRSTQGQLDLVVGSLTWRLRDRLASALRR